MQLLIKCENTYERKRDEHSSIVILIARAKTIIVCVPFKSIAYDVFWNSNNNLLENYKAWNRRKMIVTFRENKEVKKIHEKIKITKAIKEYCPNVVNEYFSAGKSVFDQDNRPKDHRVNGEINDPDES